MHILSMWDQKWTEQWFEGVCHGVRSQSCMTWCSYFVMCTSVRSQLWPSARCVIAQAACARSMSVTGTTTLGMCICICMDTWIVCVYNCFVHTCVYLSIYIYIYIYICTGTGNDPAVREAAHAQGRHGGLSRVGGKLRRVCAGNMYIQ